MDPSLSYCEPYATVICCQASVQLATPQSQRESVAINIAKQKTQVNLRYCQGLFESGLQIKYLQ